MKPKDLISINIEKTLLEPLTQIGFTFSKSTLTFKRKINEFVQTITFHLNKYNQENVCAEFWTSFGVSSKEYSKWYLAEFGKKPINISLGGELDWNIKDWEFAIINNKRETHFQIIDEKEREYVLEVFKKNILNIGIPYLDNLTNWENAAYNLVENEWFHEKASDFFMIAGNNEKALWALQEGIDCWKRKPTASFPDSKDEIYVRLSKYFEQ